MTDEAGETQAGLVDDEFLARVIADTKRFERRYERRRRMARWFMIPYAVFAVLSGCGIAGVLGARMAGTAAMLIVGYAGIIACQWAVPELNRFRDAADDKPGEAP